jgi:serine/threonine protein kinase
MLERERSILAALRHPRIPRLHDVGTTEDGCSYLALEYIEGEHLDRYCRGLSVPERLDLVVQIARVLSYVHARGVVHRDIKPSNLLVDSRGRAHLVDFGIASFIGTTTMCQAAEALTPSYASPEQLRGEPPTPAADIYSLGIVLSELLTGHRARKPTRHLWPR